jgi:hypothetical protein
VDIGNRKKEERKEVVAKVVCGMWYCMKSMSMSSHKKWTRKKSKKKKKAKEVSYQILIPVLYFVPFSESNFCIQDDRTGQ